MSEYTPQVDHSHYSLRSYREKDRWISYWYQTWLVQKVHPKTVLEIGPGEGVVTAALRRDSIEVTTCDIAPDLKPDVVGSITSLPFENKAFDLALAAEVLEHIRFEDVPKALQELTRVSRSHVVISLPHAGYTFAFEWKFPLLPRMQFLLKIPFFWKKHVFNGEHYWELGKKDFSIARFLSLARENGLKVLFSKKFPDDPAHQFFLFKIIE